MVRLIGFVAGALAFVAAHAVERAHWRDWFQGAHEPWFLNSGRAIVFTIAWVCVVSALVAAFNWSTRPVRGITIAAGAFAAMTAVLFLKEEGPGTIFPIVMVVGGAILLTSSALGAWVGTQGSVAIRRRR